MIELVRLSNPDVLCFLEGKTDIERLLQLDGFEEWMTEAGYKHYYCYWSKKAFGARTYGNEGIFLLNKVRCEKVSYGTGNPVMEMQARVMTVEFQDSIMVFTYKPQGGFTVSSLAFRGRWEQELSRHLDKVSSEAKEKNKKLAGDLNVNPKATD